MRYRLVLMLAAALMLLVSGCADQQQTLGRSERARIIGTYGLPDAFSEHSGDQARVFFPPSDPDASYPWPSSRAIFWYYFEPDLEVTIENGQVLRRGPIEPEHRRMIDDARSRAEVPVVVKKRSWSALLKRWGQFDI